jgi:hypothetical protein
MPTEEWNGCVLEETPTTFDPMIYSADYGRVAASSASKDSVVPPPFQPWFANYHKCSP